MPKVEKPTTKTGNNQGTKEDEVSEVENQNQSRKHEKGKARKKSV